MSSLTITDLKKNLGPGLGLRQGKYQLEVGLAEGLQINVLCQATSLPERNMSTTSVWHLGRKYNIRGETEYPGTFEISLVDDSEMHLRTIFDKWMYNIDNSNFYLEGVDGTRKENITPIENFGVGYQKDIIIWQLSNDAQTKVRGYKLQNAFPSSIGTVTLEDTDSTTLSQFSVVFTYSEFVPVTP
jgi:hypothetical protein